MKKNEYMIFMNNALSLYYIISCTGLSQPEHVISVKSIYSQLV